MSLRLDLSPSSTLFVVDIQAKLLPAMDPEACARLLRNANILIELAHAQGANILYSEQYPSGLGATEPGLLEALTRVEATRFEKTLFDAAGAPECAPLLPSIGQRVVLCGMETHICMLGTAQTLRTLGHEVIVPLDATCSRAKHNYRNGLDLMRATGATIANTESIVFASLKDAQHPDFKRFSKLVR
jgi:nicotinamidase-related amidase